MTGWKTYAGGIGLMLAGIGGILHGDVTVMAGLATIASGLTVIGFRSFGQKILDTLKLVK